MIRVTLINPSSRRYYLAQWDDPVTGRTKTRSTRETVRRDAERFAARLEDELNAGDYAPSAAMTWAAFRVRYTNDVSATKRIKTQKKTNSTFVAIERELNPKMLASLADPNVISSFATKLRTKPIERPKSKKPKKSKNNKAETPAPPPTYRTLATVDGHLREVRKLLRWAQKMSMIKSVPHIEFPDFDQEMKGRPLTEEEYDRFMLKMPKHIHIDVLENWKFYLKGLWLSGLRLEESERFHWTNDKWLTPDFSHRRPMFRIQAASDKGKQYRLLPMTPDFAEFLAAVPNSERHGFVFKPLTMPPGPASVRQRPNHRPTPNHIGRIISDIGKTAGIRVNETKFASAHDFRRAFGYRWAKVVLPVVLQELMRHADFKTTQKYYVGQMAEDAADEVYRALARRNGNTFGNTSPEAVDDDASQHQENSSKQD